jgi:hypothetical protein
MARHRSVAFVVTPIPLCGYHVEVKIALKPDTTRIRKRLSVGRKFQVNLEIPSAEELASGRAVTVFASSDRASLVCAHH